MGRRYSKTEAGATTSYLYDGQNAVQEKVGTTVNPILTGLGIDERFARNDANGRMYYLTDYLGSTRALTNATGTVVRRYDYTPYGQAQATGGSSDNPYQYTGRELDKSGLQYYRARYYSPEMGRFISEDSYGFAGGDANFYAYALGNPVSFNDPSGHIAWVAIPIIWVGVEFGLSVYDAYETGKTLMDPCASTATKTISASMFAVGLFLPGGGYGTAAKKAVPQVLRNQMEGNAARDAIASARPGSLIEQNFRTTGGLRRVDVLDGLTAIESKVGRTSLSGPVRQELARDLKLLRSGQVAEVQWHFAPSQVTGLSGPTGALRDKLNQYGIAIVE